MDDTSTQLNCPSCGASVPVRLKYAKLLVCGSCQTSLFLEDEVVKNVGERSALTPVPSIFEMGRRYQYRNWQLEPYGRIRFDYGGGFWDEWWMMLDSGEGRWISVDEGDIAVEAPIEYGRAPPAYDTLTIGRELTLAKQKVTVTERGDATCVGAEGTLPEVISIGETHQYAHLSGPRGLILTLEFFDETFSIHKGVWVDPFEIKAL